MSSKLRRKIALLFLVVIAAVPWTWVGVTRGRVYLLQRDNESLKKEIDDVRVVIATAIEEGPKESPDRSELSRWNVESEPDVAGDMHSIERLAQESGVHISGFDSPRSGVLGRYVFAVSGTAQPAALCEWLARIETHERLLVVRAGKVESLQDGDAPSGVSFEFAIEAYHGEGTR